MREMRTGDNIYCDCCGTELMAKIVGDNLVIKDRRHGQQHMVIVSVSVPPESLERLKSSVERLPSKLDNFVPV